MEREQRKQRTEDSEESSAADTHKQTYHLRPHSASTQKHPVQSPNKSPVLGSAVEAFCLDLMEGGWERECGVVRCVQGLGECFFMRQDDLKSLFLSFCRWLWSGTRTVADGSGRGGEALQRWEQGVTEWVCGCCQSCYGSVYDVLIKKKWEDSKPMTRNSNLWCQQDARLWGVFMCGFI